jgi:KDO2-lipid IV(A) lauroyltransferase
MILVIVFRVCGLILFLMPSFFRKYLIKKIAIVSMKRNPHKTEIVFQNLKVVFAYLKLGNPQPADILNVFETYARYYFEVLMLPFLSTGFLKKVEVRGLEQLETAMQNKKGVIILTAHIGNWDLAGAVMAQYAPYFSAVAEKLENRSLFKFFTRTRQKKGVNVVASTHSAFRNIKKSLSEQGGQGVVAILADRDMSGHGIPVTLFGQPTTIPQGPIEIAKETGTILLPGALYYKGDDCYAKGFGPIVYSQTDSVQVIAQKTALGIEKIISENPTQWCMLQPIWK